MKTKVDEIMAEHMVTTQPGSSIRETAILMAQKKVGATAVMDDGKLVGMFSERDLLNRVVAKGLDADTSTIKDVMTSPVITIEAGTTANDALYIMTVKHIRHLPVVDKANQPIGMLGIRDLLESVLNETIDDFVTAKEG